MCRQHSILRKKTYPASMADVPWKNKIETSSPTYSPQHVYEIEAILTRCNIQ